MRTWVALVLMGIAPVVAMAQRVSGTVRGSGPDNALSGVVVTTVDSAGRTIVRTLTDGMGRYSLARAANVARIRAVRIGFRPAVLDIPTGSGDVVVDLVMERAPVVLATMRVSADGSCASSGDASVVMDLWERARIALLAAIVARETKPARVQLMEYERRMDVVRRLVLAQQMTVHSGLSNRPVGTARSAAQLAATGYRGMDRGDEVYFAPDADVLFDESFSAGHCFGLRRGSGERNGQLGLTFRPRNVKRDFVDVEGVLWMNSQASELLQLDYFYTNIDPAATRVGAGGSAHFATMPNGVVIIDSWSILVPSLTEIRRSGGVGADARSVVNDLSETGGYVLSASWADSTRWSNPLGGVRGVVRSSDRNEPVEGVMVMAQGASVATDTTGAFWLPLPPGRYRLGLIDSAFAGFAAPRQQSREVVISRSDTARADFRTRSRGSVLVDLCGNDRSPGSSILLGEIREQSGQFPRNLKVRGSWVDSRGGSVTLDLSQVKQANQVAEVSSEGRFYLCNVPQQSSWITLRLEMGRTPVVDTLVAPSSIEAPSALGTRRVEWALAAAVFEAAMEGDAAVLSGRVTSKGVPVAGAEVWVVFKDVTATTDSLGRFRFAGLRAGPQIVQVRRIGYAVKRDTMTLKPQSETAHDISLDAVTELDTMRTVGKGRAYDVPRLQDFERRRLSGMGGHFISEDELRKHENRSIADILRSYTPGVRFESYRGSLYLSSASTPTMKLMKIPPNGPTGCWASVYLDGIVLYAADIEIAPPDMKQFLAMNLSGVEYYGSAANLPLQYKNTKNNCGTLLLWTRGK